MVAVAGVLFSPAGRRLKMSTVSMIGVSMTIIAVFVYLGYRKGIIK